MAITNAREFAEGMQAFTIKWGEKILAGRQADYDAALKEAAPLARYGRIIPERIVQGAAAKWERIQRGEA